MLDFIRNNWANIAQVIVSVIGTASIIVKLTPTTADDKVLAKIKNFVSKFIALNP